MSDTNSKQIQHVDSSFLPVRVKSLGDAALIVPNLRLQWGAAVKSSTINLHSSEMKSWKQRVQEGNLSDTTQPFKVD